MLKLPLTRHTCCADCTQMQYVVGMSCYNTRVCNDGIQAFHETPSDSTSLMQSMDKPLRDTTFAIGAPSKSFATLLMHIVTQPIPSSFVDSAFSASEMSPSDTRAASCSTDRSAWTKLESIQPMASIKASWPTTDTAFCAAAPTAV